MAVKNKVKNAVAGATIAALLASVPSISQDNFNKAKKENILLASAEPKSGATAENSSEKKWPVFNIDTPVGKRPCYLFKEVDEKFNLYITPEKEIVAAFTIWRDGRELKDPVRLGPALKDIDYLRGDSIGVHVADTGKKYVLFPNETDKVIIINRHDEAESDLVGNRPVADILAVGEKNLSRVSNEFLAYPVDNAGDGNPGTMVVSGNVLVIIPKDRKGEQIMTSLDAILRIEKSKGTNVESFDQLRIEPVGDASGTDVGLPNVSTVYALKVTVKGNDKFERYHIIYFEEKAGKDVAQFTVLKGGD